MKDRLKIVRKNDPHGKTQDMFAEFLGISQSNLASYETGRRTPTDAVVNLICEKCNIRKDWLIDGTGDMYVSKNSQISRMLGEVLKADENDFKRRLVTAISNLDEDGWNTLEKLIDSISKKNE